MYLLADVHVSGGVLLVEGDEFDELPVDVHELSVHLDQSRPLWLFVFRDVLLFDPFADLYHLQHSGPEPLLGLLTNIQKGVININVFGFVLLPVLKLC